jgi:hypothetical protein
MMTEIKQDRLIIAALWNTTEKSIWIPRESYYETTRLTTTADLWERQPWRVCHLEAAVTADAA